MFILLTHGKHRVPGLPISTQQSTEILQMTVTKSPPDAPGQTAPKKAAKLRLATKSAGLTHEQRNAIARKKLCNAALELFALQGYDVTTLSDIGVRAGYSRGLAHHYFDSKETLAEFLLDELSQRDSLIHILAVSYATTGAEAWEKLGLHMSSVWKHCCDFHFAHREDLAERGAFVLRSAAAISKERALRSSSEKIFDALLTRIKNILLICVRDGVLRKDMDVEKTAVFYVTSISGYSLVLPHQLISRKFAIALLEPLQLYLNSFRTSTKIRLVEAAGIVDAVDPTGDAASK